MLRIFVAYESEQGDSEMSTTMGKWQSEEEINAALRELAREVRALRTNLRRKTSTPGWPGRPHSADDRPAGENQKDNGDESRPRKGGVGHRDSTNPESSKS